MKDRLTFLAVVFAVAVVVTIAIMAAVEVISMLIGSME